MAVYHGTMRLISRSKGNPVNALAYFSGTNLYDQRTGQWFYHSHKNVPYVELLLPKDAPAWAKELQKEISENRQKGIQKFSDLVERAEKRKDAQVYREFEFALPKELTNEQNINLANEFLQDQACQLGMMVMASFHFDIDEETGESRPHCHAKMVTRRLEENGFSKTKEIEWNKKELILTFREQLAAYTNFHLKLHGHDIRIDHRSYAEQGIDLESQHMKTINRRGGFHEKTGEEIRHQYEITRQRNVARLIKRPETVFDIVTRQQSTFMWGDVEKVLARYVREEDIFYSLKHKLQSSPELVLLREEERVNMDGLKEDASIYTIQSMIRQELSLVSLAESLGERQSHATREEDVEAAINRANEQFAQQGSSLSQDQVDALRHITKGDQLSCIIGYAGAGKSTTFRAAKEVWEASGYKVYGLAPTGRAAQNLEEIGLSSQTLHKFLKDYEQGRSRYHESSVLVLDEAGMVDVKRFNELLTAVDHLGVKLVISGDGAQSQPIEAGPGFRLVTDRLDVRKIETIVRQNVEWQKEATRLFGSYQTREALDMYLDRGHVRFVDEKVPDLNALHSQKRYREVVELYNLSRRVCGNLWHSISKDLKELNILPDESLKTAVTHKDFALFKEWQHIRGMTAEHLSQNMDIYRNVMKQKGVDPVAFAAQFVNRDLPEANRHSEIRRLIKSWGLESPDALTPLHQCDLRKETRQDMVQEWQQSLKTYPEQTHLMVTYTNRDTHLLNEDARCLMRKAGVMAIEEHFHTVKRETDDDFGRPVIHESRKAFSKGERLVFTRNHKAMGVKNGTLGTIEDIDGVTLKVRIDGDNRVVSFASKLYPYFDRGWAVTIIKSQGSTADRVFKLATFEEDRNLAYVGMTRHRESLQVFGSKLDFWREEIFGNRLSQNREKLSSLDYVSEDEAQGRLKPPIRLMDALSSLGNRLESLGYYSRKGWESVCERFLGKTRPEDRIMFARGSIEETIRAKEMGINAAPSSGKREEQLTQVLMAPELKSASAGSEYIVPYSESMLGDMPADVRQGNVSQREMEDEAYRNAIIEKQNELRKHADNPEYIFSQLFGESRESPEIQPQSESPFRLVEEVKGSNITAATMQTEFSQREKEDETYHKAMIYKQNELRKYADNPEYILWQLFADPQQNTEIHNQTKHSFQDGDTEKTNIPDVSRDVTASQREMEEEAYRKRIINKQNDLRKHADNPEYIFSQLFGESRESPEIQPQSESPFRLVEEVKGSNITAATMQTEFSQREIEDETYHKAMIDKQNELRKYGDNPEYILSQLSQSSFHDAEMREGNATSSGSEAEKTPALLLPVDISTFVDEQVKVDASKKAMKTSDIRKQNRETLTDRTPSVSKDPHYSLEEVRRSLTPYGMENICLSLLGEPNHTLSNKRHLRYGSSGSLAVSLSGHSLGLWKDHSRDEGGDIFKLVQRERGGNFKDALAWVAEALRIAPEKSLRRISYASSSGNEKDQAWRLQTMNRYLKACQPVTGTLGERYLREHRGIQGELSADLGFIPSAWNHSAQKSYPALAALGRDKDGTVKGLQVVFLDKQTGKKAHCPANKKSFGMLRGAYFHVQKGDGAVFVAEGIETALSIKEAGVKGDIYATLGISNFRNANLLLEDKIRPLIICADQDGEESIPYKTVEKAGEFLKEQGFTVSIVHPNAAQGIGDFNDVLKKEGVEGVKNYFKEYLDPTQTMSERDQKILGWLEHAISTNTWSSEYTKKYYLDLALRDPENTLVRWQTIIQDHTFHPDREGGRVFSERGQRILDYMEKSVGEGDYLQNTKEYYLIAD